MLRQNSFLIIQLNSYAIWSTDNGWTALTSWCCKVTSTSKIFNFITGRSVQELISSTLCSVFAPIPHLKWSTKILCTLQQVYWIDTTTSWVRYTSNQRLKTLKQLITLVSSRTWTRRPIWKSPLSQAYWFNLRTKKWNR